MKARKYSETTFKHFNVLAGILQLNVQSAKKDASAAIWNLCSATQDKFGLCVVPNLLKGLLDVCECSNDEAKQYAAGALGHIALHPDAAQTIIRLPRCPAVLVSLLTSSSQTTQENAAAAIGNLAMDNQEHMVLLAKQDGSLEGLVYVINNGSDTGKETAVAALGNLALSPHGIALIAKPGAIKVLGSLLECGTERAKENTALTLANLALNSPENADLLVQTDGVVSGLAKLLKEGTPLAQENASLALSQIAIYVKDESKLISTKDCIQNLVSVLKQGSAVAKEDASAALGNLALRSAQAQQFIGDFPKALDYLFDIINSEQSITAVENACLALTNLSVHVDNEVRIGKIPNFAASLLKVLQSTSPSVQDAVAKIITNVSASSVENKRSIAAQAGLVAALARLLGDSVCRRSATSALLNLSGLEQNMKLIASLPGVKDELEKVVKLNAPEAHHAELLLKKFPDTKMVAPKKSLRDILSSKKRGASKSVDGTNPMLNRTTSQAVASVDSNAQAYLSRRMSLQVLNPKFADDISDAEWLADQTSRMSSGRGERSHTVTQLKSVRTQRQNHQTARATSLRDLEESLQ